MKVITARIPEKYLQDLKEIEREEHTERAEVIRKLLADAIKNWKQKKVLELLKEHKITFRKAASFAGLTYVEVLDLVSREGIDIGYSPDELEKDLGRIYCGGS